MLIDLSEILSLENRTQAMDVPVSMEIFQSKLGSFSIVKKSPLSLRITNKEKKVLELEASGELTLNIPCDRCLKEVPTKFEIAFQQELDMRLSTEERIKDLDEMNYITGCSLDTEQLVYNEILIHWPLQVLCKENCQGICPCCGRDLNQGTCGCEAIDADPRMAAIRDIFSKFKEV